MPTIDTVRLPKVLLHDHLDGGLRPATVIELADEVGHQSLPSTDPAVLASWFDQSRAGSLDRYLEAFSHTYGVMQTPAGLARVAHEAVADLAVDGVVYAEIRFAPSLHTARGLSLTEVIASVLDGVRQAEVDFGMPVGLIVDALRHRDDSVAVAEAAIAFAGEGVVGFDLAGPEGGYPAHLHRRACDVALAGGLSLTIHAGEHRPGPGEDTAAERIDEALSCGADRIGHGVLLIDDTEVAEGAIVQMGAVAQRIHDERIALELCPSSNVHTGAVPDLARHPIGLLLRAGFAVTVNTDNRLMSGTSMSREFAHVVEHQGFDESDLRAITLNAVDAAFCDASTREAIRARVEAGYR